MPALHSHPPLNPETDPARKAQILLNQFFPPPSDTDLSDIQNVQYEQGFDMGDITTHETRQAILTAILDKAPGEDGIPNRIVKSIIDLILPYLYIIFNACLSAGYCPTHFRSSITIVLRQPGKPDYTIAKAYRPIALLNTIGKALEFIIAKRITYLAETHGLLPQNHFGARRSGSTGHALHYLIERIYASWNKKKIATALLLDVTRAFDNVSKDKLLHNLRIKKIDPRIVN